MGSMESRWKIKESHVLPLNSMGINFQNTGFTCFPFAVYAALVALLGCLLLILTG
jgi:hypothetical protein